MRFSNLSRSGVKARGRCASARRPIRKRVVVVLNEMVLVLVIDLWHSSTSTSTAKG
jgi:hypothetical protein